MTQRLDRRFLVEGGSFPAKNLSTQRLSLVPGALAHSALCPGQTGFDGLRGSYPPATGFGGPTGFEEPEGLLPRETPPQEKEDCRASKWSQVLEVAGAQSLQCSLASLVELETSTSSVAQSQTREQDASLRAACDNFTPKAPPRGGRSGLRADRGGRAPGHTHCARHRCTQ